MSALNVAKNVFPKVAALVGAVSAASNTNSSTSASECHEKAPDQPVVRVICERENDLSKEDYCTSMGMSSASLNNDENLKVSSENAERNVLALKDPFDCSFLCQYGVPESIIESPPTPNEAHAALTAITSNPALFGFQSFNLNPQQMRGLVQKVCDVATNPKLLADALRNKEQIESGEWENFTGEDQQDDNSGSEFIFFDSHGNPNYGPLDGDSGRSSNESLSELATHPFFEQASSSPANSSSATAAITQKKQSSSAKGEWTKLADKHPCSVCSDLLAAPVIISCGHSFCGECIDQVIASDRANRAATHLCPYCRCEFNPDNVIFEREFDAEIVLSAKDIAACEDKTAWVNRRADYRRKKAPKVAAPPPASDGEGWGWLGAGVIGFLAVAVMILVAVMRK